MSGAVRFFVQWPCFMNMEMGVVDEVPSYYWNGDMFSFLGEQDTLIMPVFDDFLEATEFLQGAGG